MGLSFLVFEQAEVRICHCFWMFVSSAITLSYLCGCCGLTQARELSLVIICSPNCQSQKFIVKVSLVLMVGQLSVNNLMPNASRLLFSLLITMSMVNLEEVQHFVLILLILKLDHLEWDSNHKFPYPKRIV